MSDPITGKMMMDEIKRLEDEIERLTTKCTHLQTALRSEQHWRGELQEAIKAQIAANPKGSYPCLHYALIQEDET